LLTAKLSGFTMSDTGDTEKKALIDFAAMSDSSSDESSTNSSALTVKSINLDDSLSEYAVLNDATVPGSKSYHVFTAISDTSDADVLDISDKQVTSTPQQLVQQRESRLKVLERELATTKHSYFELECELKLKDEKIEKLGM
jgi:hypothetical protein